MELRRVEERRFQKLKLLNKGFKEHELVKDSHHNWRVRVEIKKRIKKR